MRIHGICAGLILSLATASMADTVGVGDAVPSTKLTTLDGQEVDLAGFKKTEEKEGKIVVLASWSFKCPSGKPLMDYHKELAKWCEEQGVVYIAIAMYGEGKDAISAFLKEKKISIPLAIDEGCKVAATFDTRVVNTAYVIDSQGVVQYAGNIQKEPDLVRQAVKELKEGRPVTVQSSKPSG